MEIAVYNRAGEDTGRKVQLDDTVFGIEPNDHAIYLDVKQHLARKRQGTHKAKEKGEITGSTRKIKRQKGTGTARAGSVKSGVLRGGGRIFGPRPRNYDFKLNKKVKQLARKSALSYKIKNNSLIVVEDFDFKVAKTKEFLTFEKNLKISDKKSLLVLSNQNKNIYLSARNLKRSKVATVSDITTYNILNASTLVLAESAIDVLQKNLGNK